MKLNSIILIAAVETDEYILQFLNVLDELMNAVGEFMNAPEDYTRWNDGPIEKRFKDALGIIGGWIQYEPQLDGRDIQILQWPMISSSSENVDR